MILRTKKNTVIFESPFTLGEAIEVFPPGAYDVETDEKLLEGHTFHAYRRILTLIHIPAKPGYRGVSRTLKIDPEDLDAALKRDAESSTMSSDRAPMKKAPMKKKPKKSKKVRGAEADNRAVDRAEDEGMTVRPQ